MDTWMHPKEIAMIEKYLHPEDTMLEWGSGGSTVAFSKKVKRYFSIEHDKTWFEKVQKNVPDNVKMFHVPLNSERTQPTQKEQVIDYINFVDQLEEEFFDKVLIDGRGRGWCAEKLLNYLHNDSVVFIHDYFKRPQYHIVENWYEIIDVVKDTPQTIVALKKKSKITS